MGQLIIIEGKGKGKVFHIREKHPITMGRSSQCDIPLGDEGISRQHCQVEFDGERYWLTDLKSRNGTLLNGVEIKDAQQLRDGDDIQVGDTHLRFEMETILQPRGRGDAGEATSLVTREGVCASCGAAITQRDSVIRGADGLYCGKCALGDSLIDKTVAGYKVLAKIGEGRTSAIYKATQVAVDRTVALKVLLPEAAANEVFVKRFMREAKAGAKLSHPNVVQTYDAGECEGLYYIVMEYVEGKTVSKLLEERGQPLDLKMALSVAIQVARALDYAHRHSMVHRDVKPGNIIVNPDGLAKLLDLGFAKSREEAGRSGITQVGRVVGTLDYMPPEQTLDSRGVDHRADIYALGATLYRVLTGRMPFGGTTLKEKMKNIREQTPESPKKLNKAVPDSVCRIIEKAMHRNRDERYQNVEALLLDLELARKYQAKA